MNPLVFHVASGQSFFSGLAMLVGAALASQWPRPIYRRVSALLFLLGVTAIVISSTAIAVWCYVIGISALLVWLFSGLQPDWRLGAPYTLMLACAFLAIAELPYHLMPTIKLSGQPAITVIGDSVTAGAGESDTAETWPKLLARERQIKLHDISHVGETAGSALKRVKGQPVLGDVVIVEIGGNDVLGTTTVEDFDRDLNMLLRELSVPNRQIVMFELPLPPFYHAFGRAQRTAATRHGVALIPKRVFLSVLAGEEATLDTIHLSQAGHQQMANTVWQILEPGFKAVPAKEQR